MPSEIAVDLKEQVLLKGSPPVPETFKAAGQAAKAAGSRAVLALVSTEDRDRDGDVVRCAGLDWEDWMSNPVILWVHDTRSVPVGRGLSVRKNYPGPGQTTIEVEFADTPMGRDLYKLYAGGFLSAWSISFIWEERKRLLPPTEAPDAENEYPAQSPLSRKPAASAAVSEPATQTREAWGWDILKGTVLEVSACSVPSNQATRTLLAQAKALGLEALADLVLEPGAAERQEKADASELKFELRGLDSKTLFSGTPFKKTVAERGAKGVRCEVVSAEDGEDAPALSMTITPMQEKVVKGLKTITEARIESLRLSVPKLWTEAPEEAEAYAPADKATQEADAEAGREDANGTAAKAKGGPDAKAIHLSTTASATEASARAARAIAGARALAKTKETKEI